MIQKLKSSHPLEQLFEKDNEIEKKFDDLIDTFKLDDGERYKTQISKIQIESAKLQKKKSSFEIDKVYINQRFQNPKFSDSFLQVQQNLSPSQELIEIENNINGPDWKNYLNQLIKIEGDIGQQAVKDHLSPVIFLEHNRLPVKLPNIKLNQSSQSPSNRSSVKKIKYTGQILNNSFQEKNKKKKTTKLLHLTKQEIILNVHQLRSNYIDNNESISGSNKVHILNQMVQELCSYESPYQEYLQFIFEQIHQFLFCNEDDILNTVREIFFFDKEKEQTYLQVTRRLHSYILKLKSNLDKQKRFFLDHINQQKILIAQLSKDADANKEIMNQAIKLKEEELIKQRADIEEELQNSKTHMISLKQTILELKETIFSMQERFNQERLLASANFDQRLKEINVTNYELKSKTDVLEQELNQQRMLADDYKNKWQTAFASLKFANENIQNLNQKNFELENERARLAVRGAVGFTELTPRPSFQKYYELLEISPKYEPKSTQGKVDQIFNKVYEKFCKKQPFIQDQDSLDELKQESQSEDTPTLKNSNLTKLQTSQRKVSLLKRL